MASAIPRTISHCASLIVRHTTFFETELYLLRTSGPVKLNLPLKSTVQELVDGQLLLSLQQDWTDGDSRFTQGSLLSIDLDAAYSDPEHLGKDGGLQPRPAPSRRACRRNGVLRIVTVYVMNVATADGMYDRAQAAGRARRWPCPTTRR